MRKRLIPIYSVLVVAIVLLGVLVPSCSGGARTFALTMAVNPLGSGNAVDLTGGSPYASGATVNVTATPLGSYTFVKWTAPAGTFANANAAATTFTMPAQNVTVTANFRGPLDHFKCYSVADAGRVDKSVTLTDQFVSINATVGQAVWFVNPTAKVHMPPAMNISNPDHHFTFYNITYAGGPRTWYVEVENQFGNFTLTVSGPHMLAVPSQKVQPGNHRPPLSLDHFLVYQVINGPLIDAGVGLKDQFGDDPSVQVGETFLFANPVQKTVGDVVFPIRHPDEHLVFYRISGTAIHPPTMVQVVNQFNTQTQNLYLGETAGLLGVPSKKVDFGEQIDHFKSYTVGEEPPLGMVVSLRDQFVNVNATVGQAFLFCNPAQKVHGQPTPILDPDHHFMIYLLTDVVPRYWSVEIQNQFGIQDLIVYGPTALAVPTQKLEPNGHQPPKGLDHYLLYRVLPSSYEPTVVGLTDEFGGEPQGAMVQMPIYFANPVEKTVGTVVTPIENKMAHLVFYGIIAQVYYPEVLIVNQLESQPHYYDLTGPQALIVPSAKLRFSEEPG